MGRAAAAAWRDPISCISLSEYFCPSPAVVLSVSDMQRKWRLLSHWPINTQTCYVTMCLQHTAADAAQPVGFCFSNLTCDVLLDWRWSSGISGFKCVTLTVHPNTAGSVSNILRRYSSVKKLVSNPWSLTLGNLVGYFSRDSHLWCFFFFPL